MRGGGYCRSSVVIRTFAESSSSYCDRRVSRASLCSSSAFEHDSDETLFVVLPSSSAAALSAVLARALSRALCHASSFAFNSLA